MISSQNLSQLPDINDFVRLSQALAALDSIVSPEWEYRYYSFDRNWAKGEMMASMRNGSGDSWLALILDSGIAIHGLDHESVTYEVGQPKSWVFADLPREFEEPFLNEPAFDTSNSTFCIWRKVSDNRWHSGASLLGEEVSDGSEHLLGILTGSPEQYVEFAEDYYEEALPLDVVCSVYEHHPITPGLAKSLNAEIVTSELIVSLDGIGYPHTL